ncbi:MAG: Cobalt-zinc-cadmium resistance protein CzcA; Cation efflux system protein CusA, partial [uncultured Ramlibacter sp.]
DERFVLVDPQPDSSGDAVRAADLRRLPRLQGHEGAELPRHRSADRDGECIAAGRLAFPARDRRRAQDRELDRHGAGHQAHHDQGAGRRRHHHRRVPPREAGAGSGGRRAIRRVAGASGPAGRPARSGRFQAGPGGAAGAGLHHPVDQ